MGLIATPPGATHDVIVVGRAGMDLYPDPPGTRTHEAARFTSDLGGSAGNIAVALARHGARVALAAPVSDDPVGEFVQAQLAAYGVEHLTPEPVQGHQRTSLALAESIAEGSRTVIYRNDAADFVIKDLDLSDDIAATARALVVTGTALASEPSRSSCLAALRAAPTAILDLDYRPYSWSDPAETREVYAAAMQVSDIIVGNVEEFAQLTDGDGFQAALSWSETALVLYKMGAEGCQILHNGRAGALVPPFKTRALKPFGAGDAFLGGTLAKLLDDTPLEEALRFGAAAAALVVSRIGCASAMPDTAETLDFITRQS